MFLDIVVIAIATILDYVFMAFFPNDFLISSGIFISNMGLFAMILITRNYSKYNAYLCAISYGIVYGFIFTNQILVYPILFVGITCLVRIWSKRIMKSVLESFVLCIALLFMKDIFVYLFMIISQQTQLVNFPIWFYNYEFKTIIMNAVLFFVIFGIHKFFDKKNIEKKVIQRKYEKISWYHIKSKER